MTRYRVLWSDFEYNQPIKIIIPDWNLIKTLFYNKYLLVDALMEYKDREIELCIPYMKFIMAIKFLKADKQKLIKDGNAIITLMKTFKKVNHGIVIKEVELWHSSDKK